MTLILHLQSPYMPNRSLFLETMDIVRQFCIYMILDGHFVEALSILCNKMIDTIVCSILGLIFELVKRKSSILIRHPCYRGVHYLHVNV